MTSPLAAAARAFAEIAEFTDSAVVIDDRLKAVFADAHEELQYRVDKRIFFHRELEVRKEAVEAAIEHYKAQLAYLKEVHEKAKAICQAEVEAEPSIEFRGKLGKIWVQKNTPGVDYGFGENRPQKLETLQFYGVPEEFITTVALHKVDSDKTLAALDAGELKWAKKKPGFGVRFSPLKKPKEIEG